MIGHSWDSIRENVQWKEWNPGLDNGHLTLGEVLHTLPASNPADIPWIVRLFENPNPPIKIPELCPLPGAISLERHDAIHILLGRGLLPQDEAFVIGFTMGATKGCSDWHYSLFRFIGKHLYPKFYKFTEDHLKALDLGFTKGRKSLASDLGHFPFEDHLDLTIDQLREKLGINRQQLYATYRLEKTILPDTLETKRLDIDFQGVDPSVTSKGNKNA